MTLILREKNLWKQVVDVESPMHRRPLHFFHTRRARRLLTCHPVRVKSSPAGRTRQPAQQGGYPTPVPFTNLTRPSGHRTHRSRRCVPRGVPPPPPLLNLSAPTYPACVVPRVPHFVFTVSNFAFLLKFNFHIFEFEIEITYFPDRNSLPGE